MPARSGGTELTSGSAAVTSASVMAIPRAAVLCSTLSALCLEAACFNPEASVVGSSSTGAEEHGDGVTGTSEPYSQVGTAGSLGAATNPGADAANSGGDRTAGATTTGGDEQRSSTATGDASGGTTNQSEGTASTGEPPSTEGTTGEEETCALAACNQAAPDGPALPVGDAVPTALLLEDFDDCDPVPLASFNDAPWYVFADPTTGEFMCPSPSSESASQGMLVPGGPDGSSAALSVRAPPVAIYAGFGIDIGNALEPFDAGAFQGVIFDVTGSGWVRLVVSISSLVPLEAGGRCDSAESTNCNDTHFSEPIQLRSAWRRHAISFEQLTQDLWSGTDPVPLDRTDLMQLQWFIGEDGANVVIDNVGFY